MALINCPECKREISDYAEACPHCGYPIKKMGLTNPSAEKEQENKREPEIIYNPMKRSDEENDKQRKITLMSVFAFAFSMLALLLFFTEGLINVSTIVVFIITIVIGMIDTIVEKKFQPFTIASQLVVLTCLLLYGINFAYGIHALNDLIDKTEALQGK